MDDFILITCQNLEANLKNLNSIEWNLMKNVENILSQIKCCLAELKIYIIENGFASLEDEIRFFKEIKPNVFCHLIYYMSLYRIELERPVWCISTQKAYLEKEVEKLSTFFAQNAQFFHYMRNGMQHFDIQFFTRGKTDLQQIHDPLYFEADPLFSTSHDHKAACIKAYSLLGDYLKNEIKNLDSTQTSSQLKSNISWTDSKVSLVELIYALNASGCLNNGNTDIKELACFFESIFGVELGDYYRIYQNLKTRTNHTKFLNALSYNLLRKIEQEEML